MLPSGPRARAQEAAIYPADKFQYLALMIASGTLIAAGPITQADLGPAPTWEQAISTGETAIRARLINPESAKIEWPYNFVGGSFKPLLGKTRMGYWTCGLVNARNRMGGFAGQSWFTI